MKIQVVGFFGNNNTGDESYKLSFPILFPEHEFYFSNSILPSDAYILGGGDVVFGHYLDALRYVKNKHIMSTTMSNVVEIGDFDTISVRDLRSMEFAKKSKVEAVFAPDFAFALTPDPIRGKKLITDIFQEEKGELYSKVVVVTINGFLLPSEKTTDRDAVTFQTMAYELARCFDNTGASFLFVPFGTKSPTDDRISNAWTASKCKFWKKNVNIFQRMGVQDTLDIISASDAVISTRLHSSIFSCLSGVPFIDILHNHKNESFLETIGYNKYSVSYRDLNPVKIKNDLLVILNEDKQTCKELSDISSNYKNMLLHFSQKVLF